VAADGRTVRVSVLAERPPEPSALDVVLSGRVLDDPARRPPGRSGGVPRWTPPAQQTLAVDPGRPGDLEVVESDYALPGILVPGMAERVEMVGHVVEPREAAGDRPLVVLLHGRHIWCYDPATRESGWEWPCTAGQRPVPSHRGYGYLQRLLASQGYVTVSVAANGVNAQDDALPDAGAAARAQLVRAHLDHWAEEVAAGRRRADLDRVVLVGHSRGGEGVARAALEIPLAAPYRVVGQLLLAPTDFSRQTTPYVPTVTVLPSCDGDVADLQGQAYTDVGRDLTTDDTALKSSVLAVGANHNYFNTEWTPGLAEAPAEDDWWSDEAGACARGADTRLDAARQRSVAAAYVAGAVHLFAAADARVLPMYDGSPVRVDSVGDAVVLSHTLGGGRTLRRPGLDARPTSPAGAVTALCRGITGPAVSHCGHPAGDPMVTPHWPASRPRTPWAWALRMDWAAAGGRGGLAFDAPLDLAGAASLDLRTVVDTRVGDVEVEVVLTDADGDAARSPAALLPAMPRGPRWFPGRFWAQTLRVDLTTLDPVGDAAGDGALDLDRVRAVELVGRSPDGRVWVLDAAARPRVAPPVPVKRLPLVDLGRVRVTEGGRGERTAHVPFDVTGSVAAAGSFRVFAEEQGSGSRRRIDVPVPVGATEGSVEWRYTGNRLDSVPRVAHQLTAYATRDVMLRDHLGRVVVVDDDPAPRIRLRRVRGSVREGSPAVWEVVLSRRVDHDLGFALSAVRGPGTAVRRDDVGARWLRRWTWNPHGGNPPLHRIEVGYFRTLPAGRTRVRLVVPIRQDRRAEGRESLTVRVRAVGVRWRSGPATVDVRRGR
jgi:hypothetical protein